MLTERAPTIVTPSEPEPPLLAVENGDAEDSRRRRDLTVICICQTDPFLLVAIAAWYFIGVLAIVTTKIQLTEWHAPPILLTFQQLVLSSTFLYTALAVRRQIQPWPWHHESKGEGLPTLQTHSIDFLLAGLFNSLDFLASNTAFSHSAASFVETIKASEPITTTIVALVWGVDRLGREESASLALLIVGVLLSTMGNASIESHTIDTTVSINDSVKTMVIVMTANLCFAFRAMKQKMYRKSSPEQMDDMNLLCRMQQVGAMALVVPVVTLCYPVLQHAFSADRELQLRYAGLAMVNAASYATYK